MATYLVRNSCLLAEAVVFGYGSPEQAIDAVRRDMLESPATAHFCHKDNFSVEEVPRGPCIIWRGLEEE